MLKGNGKWAQFPSTPESHPSFVVSRVMLKGIGKAWKLLLLCEVFILYRTHLHLLILNLYNLSIQKTLNLCYMCTSHYLFYAIHPI